MKTATFNLGGCPWTVTREEIAGLKWKRKVEYQNISISTHYEGVLLSDDAFNKCLWQGIVFTIIDDLMQKRNGIYANSKTAYASLVAQIVPQMNLQDYKSQYPVQIGGNKVTIRLDNEYCKTRKVYGDYDSNALVINISDGNYEKDSKLYTTYFIVTLIMHELMHGVCYELGLEDTKFNSETFVNTMAQYLTEVMYSLVITDDSRNYEEFMSRIGKVGIIIDSPNNTYNNKIEIEQVKILGHEGDQKTT